MPVTGTTADGFNIADVLFVCWQLTPETGTGYWYQKTGQCEWPFRYWPKDDDALLAYSIAPAVLCCSEMEVLIQLLQRDSLVADGHNGRFHCYHRRRLRRSLAIWLDRHVPRLDQLHHVSSKVAGTVLRSNAI